MDNENSISDVKKNLGGRPKFEPTDEERKLVENLSGAGVPVKSIATLVRDGIDDKTLMKHFRRELDVGKARANATIGKTLFNQAVGGNISAAIFWAKSQMGWSEKQIIDHSFTSGDINLTNAEKLEMINKYKEKLIKDENEDSVSG